MVVNHQPTDVNVFECVITRQILSYVKVLLTLEFIRDKLLKSTDDNDVPVGKCLVGGRWSYMNGLKNIELGKSGV